MIRAAARLLLVALLGAFFLTPPGFADTELRDPDPDFVPPDCPRTVDYSLPPREVPDTGRTGKRVEGEGFVEVGIFYATNRARSESCKPHKIYGDGLGVLEVGRALVTVPRDHRIGEIESPSIWRLEFGDDPEKHITVASVDPTEAELYYQELREAISWSPTKQAFVFIHGYNHSFEDAAQRTAQIAYDLKFPGPPILYSWPSAGTLSAYHRDREAGARSAALLAEFLDGLRRRSGADTIHLIAHSMGNHPLALALAQLVPAKKGEDLPLFQELVLAAPDIDAEVFEKEIAPVITAAASRVTLYASSRDRALRVARDFVDFRRLGDASGGVPVFDQVETVEASFVDTSLTGHSYFGENRSVISDLYILFRSREPARERVGLVAVDGSNGTYWRFQR